MSENDITRALADLRQQISELPAADSAIREKMQGLLSDLEQQLGTVADVEPNHDLAEDIKEAISEFEIEHPRLTGILNDIMIALGNLGI
ncbi:MAG: DUF4404 family protein [Methylotetracoccus sp.]